MLHRAPSFGLRNRSKYQPETGTPRKTAWCHLGGKARPSSFELGGGKGNGGVSPGIPMTDEQKLQAKRAWWASLTADQRLRYERRRNRP